MFTKVVGRALVVIVALSLVIIGGCSDNKPTEPAPFPTSNQVFLDNFGPNVTFQAFLGSKLDALNIDATSTQAGTQSLIVTVPDPGDPSGSYAGGAFVSTISRNLTEYNALTFYARASMDATINVVGIGNDNTGSSRFTAELADVAVTTTWTKYVIPTPNPEKLTSERGLFYFAEGPEGGSGYTLWFDEIQFETLGTIANPQPTIPGGTIDAELGDTLTLQSGSVTFDVDGTMTTVSAMPGYFTYFSSDTSVVQVAGNGVVSTVGLGTASITASLGTVPASGSISVTVVAPSPRPTTPAPTPTVPSSDVISLYSNAYTDVPVNTWSADWDVADVFDEMIGTDDVKKYENLAYAGIEFTSPTIDASTMTHFHVDAWTPVTVTPTTQFKVKLVDFGADGAFGGGDDVEHELTFTQSTTPALVSQNWVSLDIPLEAFTNLTTTGHLAQLVISGTQLPTVYVDNIYLYDAGTPTEPLLPAPTPAQPSANVISLYSDAYTDVTVDTWSADWDNADVSDELVFADNVKKYSNFVVAGVEFITSTIDASSMSKLHLDIWTPSPTDLPAQFKIKLVDFGADGAFAGGDDVEHELVFDRNSVPSLVTGSWVSFDIPLADFTNLTTTGHLAQLVLSGDPNTLFVDNVYFYAEGPQAPPTPAPTPTVDAADVVSLFSDAYTDVPVDTWSAVWDSAEVEDYPVGSDNTKKYTDVLFAGVEFATTTVDASAMTHFHMDIWTPDPTDAPVAFDVKLVDFGADGAYAGGDDVEDELSFDETTLATGTWVSIDVPLADFAGLTTKGHLAQLIFTSDFSTFFVDNIYFYNANLPTEPQVAAPTPTADPDSVISMFSDAYTNVPITTWSAVGDQANVENFVIGTDTTKKYTNLFFAIVDFRAATIDATSMNYFHLDVWTPDPTSAPSVFKIKLIDFGPNGVSGGGDDVDHELTFDSGTMNTSSWVSIDVPMTALTNLTTRAHLAQMIISGTPNTVFLDNVYFYR